MIETALNWTIQQPIGLVLFAGAVGIVLIMGLMSIRPGGPDRKAQER
jgi:hypothetical protein